jgi:hypothetical protein
LLVIPLVLLGIGTLGAMIGTVMSSGICFLLTIAGVAGVIVLHRKGQRYPGTIGGLGPFIGSVLIMSLLVGLWVGLLFLRPYP